MDEAVRLKLQPSQARGNDSEQFRNGSSSTANTGAGERADGEAFLSVGSGAEREAGGYRQHGMCAGPLQTAAIVAFQVGSACQSLGKPGTIQGLGLLRRCQESKAEARQAPLSETPSAAECQAGHETAPTSLAMPWMHTQLRFLLATRARAEGHTTMGWSAFLFYRPLALTVRLMCLTQLGPDEAD